jgi:hypothetical protein
MPQVIRTVSRYNKAACPELGAPSPVKCHGRFAADRNPAERTGRASVGIARRVKRTTRSIVVGEIELKRIEDALLDALLETHANADNALDRLLDDMAAQEAAGRDEMGFDDHASLEAEMAAPSKRSKIEELLVAAVIDNHPRRNAALDRIFADLTAVQEEAARYDMGVDGDFDGLA